MATPKKKKTTSAKKAPAKTVTRTTVGRKTNLVWDEKTGRAKTLPKGQYMDSFGTIHKNPKGKKKTTKVQRPKKK
jgi:hypothetical protein